MEEVPLKTRKNYYANNLEKSKQSSKRYYEERGGKEKKQDYYKANKEMLIQRSKARYQANKDNILERKRLKLLEKRISEQKVEEDGNVPSNYEVNQSTTK